MRVAISVVALVLVAALGLPAGAVEPAPHITDPAGDANALNGQGLVTGSAAQGHVDPRRLCAGRPPRRPLRHRLQGRAGRWGRPHVRPVRARGTHHHGGPAPPAPARP